MAVLIFDLDGTLINTGPYTIEAYRRVLGEYHYTDDECPTDDEILRTFGLPDTDIWANLMPRHSTVEQTVGFQRAGQLIRESIENNSILLPHAKEVLQTLHERGHTLTTASNCGQDYIDAVMETQGIEHLFQKPLCLETVNGVEKADILRAQMKVFGREGLYMIGDRLTDAEAARKVGMPFVGCDFGFGDREELAGAQFIIRELPELLTYFP